MLRLRDFGFDADADDERWALRDFAAVDDEAEDVRLPNVVMIRFFFGGFLKKFKLIDGSFMIERY